MYNFIQSIYFVVTIVYDKLIGSNPFVLTSYNTGMANSIADCASDCEKESICVVTYIINGRCTYYKLSDGAEKAALTGLMIMDYAGTAYAIKQ